MRLSPKIMGFGTIATISTILLCGMVRTTQANYLCDYYDCGMGTCKNSSVFPFVKCECEYGWKRPHADPITESRAFLPCVIPNCTLNYNCSDAIYPPAPSQVYSGNLSYPDPFSPCEWDICGAGTCMKMPNASHACLCHQGYENLMNRTIGYCVTTCQIGADCAAKGVTIAGNSSKTVIPAASSPNIQVTDSPQASVSATSGCAKLARDYAGLLIAKLFIILIMVLFIA